jgi:pyroglutamyl-peptidase
MVAPRILLTGFEPFGGEPLNPSWLVAQALHGRQIGGARVTGVQLPCVFGVALEALARELQRVRPVLVLALGQAAGRAELSIERVAINVDDARIPDNAMACPLDAPVVPGAPAAYFSTLPIKAMAAAVARAGFPVAISQTAGTFVCNHVFFGLQHQLAGTTVRSGFMHVPLLPEQAAAGVAGARVPSMPLHAMVQGIRVALAAALRHAGDDLRVTGGAVN